MIHFAKSHPAPGTSVAYRGGGDKSYGKFGKGEFSTTPSDLQNRKAGTKSGRKRALGFTKKRKGDVYVKKILVINYLCVLFLIPGIAGYG